MVALCQTSLFSLSTFTTRPINSPLGMPCSSPEVAIKSFIFIFSVCGMKFILIVRPNSPAAMPIVLFSPKIAEANLHFLSVIKYISERLSLALITLPIITPRLEAAMPWTLVTAKPAYNPSFLPLSMIIARLLIESLSGWLLEIILAIT